MKTLGVVHADIKVLAETSFIADSNRDRRGRPVFTPAERTQCLNFCAKVGVIKNPWTNPSEHISLTKKRDLWHGVTRVAVDGGEAQLFGYTHRVPNCTIWIADKKCLIALALLPEWKPIHKRVTGRVYCLERLCREMIQRHGFNTVSGLATGTPPDVLRLAIAKGRSKCCDHLKAAEDQLQIDCCGLLVP
jgi:hypothetical protein